jgi:hypothetical protein
MGGFSVGDRVEFKKKSYIGTIVRVRHHNLILTSIDYYDVRLDEGYINTSIRVLCGLTTVHVLAFCGVGQHGFGDLWSLGAGAEKRNADASGGEIQCFFGGLCEPRSPRRRLGLRQFRSR